jgi:hypothetical protein
LELEDFPALSSDLDAHVLDFGSDVIYPHGAPSMLVRVCGKGQAPCVRARRKAEAA